MKKKKNELESLRIFTLTPTLFILSLIALGLVLFPVIYYLSFRGYMNVAEVWWKLQRIPEVRVISIKPSVSENYAITTIKIKGKGEMTFSGWSLTGKQFEKNNIKSIGLSKIGSCEIVVVDEHSYRGWIQLDKEIGSEINTVQQAIDSYDKILDVVKSYPRIPASFDKPGFYSNCVE